ncbi:hypothetical protein [Brevibacillus laterosporus]|uniref:hypothetical protein n=1 Tax=Brevibacillus laterosporus TaxID=1465 RepID=UPI003D1FDC16
MSDEQDRPSGGRIQRFENGSIIWSDQTGAYVEQPTPPSGPGTTPTPTPSQPTINVSKQDSKLIVIGSNFNPNASIRIRVVVGFRSCINGLMKAMSASA